MLCKREAAPGAQQAGTRKQDTISLPLATFFVAKASIGAGILFVPSYYARLGLIPGLLATLLGAATTGVTAWWVALSARRLQTPDYVRLVGSMAGGRPAEVVVALLALSMAIASLVVYLRLISDTLVSAFAPLFSTSRDAVSLVLAITVLLPLSCIRGIARLGWISVAGVCGMCYVIAVVVADMLAHPRDTGIELVRPPDAGSFAAMSGLMFAYASQFWTPQLACALPVRSHGDPKDEQSAETDSCNAQREESRVIARVIISGTSIACAAYFALGISGYLRFGRRIADLAVIHAYSPAAPPTAYFVGQLALTLVYVLSIPLKIAPLRLAIRGILGFPESMSTGSDGEDDTSWIDWRNMTESTVLIAIILAISRWASKSTLALFDLAGSFGSAPIALIFPALMAVFLLGQHRSTKANGVAGINAWIVATVVCVAAIGAVLMASGIYKQLLSTIRGMSSQ